MDYGTDQILLAAAAFWQLVFLPGFIVYMLLGLKEKGAMNAIMMSVALSGAVNVPLFMLLLDLSLMRPAVLYTLMILEKLFMLWLIRTEIIEFCRSLMRPHELREYIAAYFKRKKESGHFKPYYAYLFLLMGVTLAALVFKYTRIIQMAFGSEHLIGLSLRGALGEFSGGALFEVFASTVCRPDILAKETVFILCLTHGALLLYAFFEISFRSGRALSVILPTAVAIPCVMLFFGFDLSRMFFVLTAAWLTPRIFSSLKAGDTAAYIKYALCFAFFWYTGTDSILSLIALALLISVTAKAVKKAPAHSGEGKE